MDSASQCLLFRDTLRLGNTIENNEPRLISALGLASLAGFQGWDAHMKNTAQRSLLAGPQ